MTDGTVSKIMATDVVALDRNASLGIAKDIMDQRRLRHFPVVEHGNVVGVVSQRDLFRASLASMLGYEERTKKAFLDNLSIKGVMSDPPITVTADTRISEAARLMDLPRGTVLSLIHRGKQRLRCILSVPAPRQEEAR